MSKSKFQAIRRAALPLVAGVAVLSLAVACAKGKSGAARVGSKPTPEKHSSEIQNVLNAAFKAKYNPAAEQNLALAARIEGASAWVSTSSGDMTESKVYDVQVKILVADSTGAEKPATIVAGLGSTFWGEQNQAKTYTDDTGARTEIKLLKTGDETSSEGKGKFRVQSVCLNEDCSQLAVRLFEMLEIEPQKDSKKVANRQRREAGFIFQRAAERGGDADPSQPYMLVWGPKVKADDENSGVKMSFEGAVEARKAKKLEILPSEVLPGTTPTPSPEAPVTDVPPTTDAPTDTTTPPTTDPSVLVDTVTPPTTDAAPADPGAATVPADGSETAPATEPAASPTPTPAPQASEEAPAP